MIKSFKCKDTALLFNRGKPKTRKFPADILERALNKLILLHNAGSLKDLRVLPGNRLEPLKGNRKGGHSIRINAQYRLCFKWKGADAFDVEICDYH